MASSTLFSEEMRAKWARLVEEEGEEGQGCEQRTAVVFRGKSLQLRLSWKNEEQLAPLFSGACWAGTCVWEASLQLANYLSDTMETQLQSKQVVELGCGIGVPGMVARLLGAKVHLTEQEELVGLLKSNIETNFPHDASIQGRQLDWTAPSDITNLMESFPPDVVLCADCVYEPLYGESWKHLLTVLQKLARPETTVLISVERRTADGVDKFLCEARGLGFGVELIRQVAEVAPVEVYGFSTAE